MRPLTICVAVTGWCAATFPSAFAQTPPLATPKFSGVWVMDATRSEAAAGEQPVNAVIAITHSGSMLKVETVRDGQTGVVTYPIGAAPIDTTEVSAVRRAFWNGPVLVDEGSVDINGRTIGYREARMQGAEGDEMIVETTLKVERGYDVKGAHTMVTGKNVYVHRR